MVVDSGKFDWGKHAARFPQFVEPSAGYHGLKFWETFGPLAFAIRVRVEILRDLGTALNPFAAQQLLLGLETLSLRAERHASNAIALAKWLQKNENVSWVSYPGLEDHPSHETAKRYLQRGFSGVLSFGVKGGSTAGIQLVDGFKLISNLAKYVMLYSLTKSSSANWYIVSEIPRPLQSTLGQRPTSNSPSKNVLTRARRRMESVFLLVQSTLTISLLISSNRSRLPPPLARRALPCLNGQRKEH